MCEWSDSRAGGFMFVFRPGLLERAPHLSSGSFAGRATSGSAARCRPISWLGPPNVSVIDGREMLAAIQSVVDNVTLAVSVVGTLVMICGLLILVGAVAMTKFRRVYEAAIFKTLGATRRLIAAVLLLEYGLLGRARRRDRICGRPGAHLGHQPVRLRHPLSPAGRTERGRRWSSPRWSSLWLACSPVGRFCSVNHWRRSARSSRRSVPSANHSAAHRTARARRDSCRS